MSATSLKDMIQVEDPRGFGLLNEWLGAEGWAELFAALAVMLGDESFLSDIDYYSWKSINALRDANLRSWHQRTLMMLPFVPTFFDLQDASEESGRTDLFMSACSIVYALSRCHRSWIHLEQRHLLNSRDRSLRSDYSERREIEIALRDNEASTRAAAKLFADLPAKVRLPYEPLAAVRDEIESIPIELAFSLHGSLVEFGALLDDNPARSDSNVEDWWRSWTDRFGYGISRVATSFWARSDLVKICEVLGAAANAFDPTNLTNLGVLQMMGAISGGSPHPECQWHGRKMDISKTHTDLVALGSAYRAVLTRLDQGCGSQ